jgi:hypothetical protein
LPAADENVSDRKDHRCNKLLLPMIHRASHTENESVFNPASL